MTIFRGEVWLVNLDPTIGAEIQKTRPCVVVNEDQMNSLPLRIIVPISEWKERYAQAQWHVHLVPTKSNGLKKESTADTFQVRSISETRFNNKIGELSSVEMELIEQAILVSLGIDI